MFAQQSLLYGQVSAGGGQQERTEIMKIRTDSRREQGSQDASEQDPDQSGSPREEAREDRENPKLTVSVSLDRKEQPLPKWAWPGRSLDYRQVRAGEGQQERTEIFKIRTDSRRKQGSQDAREMTTQTSYERAQLARHKGLGGRRLGGGGTVGSETTGRWY